jgi:LDH2 family malate/lactate/ureidoglycolate dehydrogenase
MKPDLFVPQEDYRNRMDTLIERVHACPTAPGFDEVLMPGEPERRHEDERRRSGIPYSANEVAALQEEAAKAGIAPLNVSPNPLRA